MLARYKIPRGRPVNPLPDGHRQDTRKHTRHCLRPEAKSVFRYLAEPSDAAWIEFEGNYRQLIEARFQDDPEPFRALARLATVEDVFLGCSCPTRANPNPWYCHTRVALEFMKERFPELEVQLPPKQLGS